MEFRSEREKLKEILNNEFYDYSINRIIRDFDFEKPHATRNYRILRDIVKKTYKEEVKGSIPMEINNEDFMKGFYLGNSEKERFEAEMKLDNPEAEIELLGRRVEMQAGNFGWGPKDKITYNEMKTFEVSYPRI